MGVQADTVPRSKRVHGHLSLNGRKVGLSPFARPRTPVSARHYSPSRFPLQAGPSTAPLTTITNGHGLGPRPAIQRVQSGGAVTQSLSMGVIGPVPRSARRWARTAHIHEVKGRGSRSESNASKAESERSRSSHTKTETEVGEDEDVFGPRPLKAAFELEERTVRFPVVSTSTSIPLEVEASEGDGWEDTDVDAEGEFSSSPDRTVVRRQ